MMRNRLVTTVAAMLLLTECVDAAQSEVDVAALERTCDALLGTQFGSRAWLRLRSYVQDPKAFDTLQVFCGAGSCGESVPLRGGLSFEFRCSAARKLGVPWAPDEMVVYFVSLKRGEHTIYHRERRPVRKA